MIKKNQLNHNYKTGLTFLLFVCFLIGCDGQKSEFFSFPEKLENERTPEHIRVEGTHLWIVPPPDFTYWRQERAFLNMTQSDSSLIIVQENKLNYYDYLKEFRTQYNQSPMEVQKEESFVLNGIDGTFLHLIEDEHSKGFRILMGDSAITIFVMATYPARNSRIEKELFNSLLTIYLQKDW